MKHHGPVPKTNTYFRNVILGKDGEPKRFVRSSDRAPEYIIQNGKPILRNKNRHKQRPFTYKSNHKIPTQQQWNNRIRTRQMKRKVKEQRMKYQINNRYGITTTKSEVHNRATYNQDNRNYASVNPKTMKN